MQVIKNELKDAFLEDAELAFIHFFSFVRDEFMKTIGETELTADDKNIIGDILNIVQLNPNFGSALLIKYYFYLSLLSVVQNCDKSIT